MNHEPYETWIFTSESLTAEQFQELREHLETCEACQKLEAIWNEAETLLRNTSPTYPTPGFTARWLIRLASRRSLEQQKKMCRLTWWFFAFAATSAIVFFLLSMMQVLPIYDSPVDFFIGGIYLLSSTISMTSALKELVATLTRVIIQAIPPYWLAGLFSMAGLLCLLWIVLLRKLLLPRRILS